MAGEAPDWSFDFEILFEIARPEDRAFLCIEAQQVPLAAERKMRLLSYIRWGYQSR
jgi:hypothetical protein